MSQYKIQIEGPGGKITSRGWAREITPEIASEVIGSTMKAYFLNAICTGANPAQEGEITVDVKYLK